MLVILGCLFLSFHDAPSLWQYARGRTLVRWAAYLSTLLCVLEYTARRTGVIQTNVLLYASPTYWYTPEQRTGFISQQRIGLIIPVDVLFITLELHLLCHACLFQGIRHHPLLLGSEGCVASSALVIVGATELLCQYHQEYAGCTKKVGLFAFRRIQLDEET